MRIVMLALGTWGDVRPYVVLAQALQEGGFDVLVVAAEEFREWVEARGLAFAGMRVNIQSIMESMMSSSKSADTGNSFIGAARHYAGIMASTTRQMGEDLIDIVREGDVLLYVETIHHLVHGILDKYRLRSIIVSLFPMTPTAAFPIFNLPDLPAWMPARGLYNRMSGDVLRRATWEIVGRQGNKIRTEQLHLSRRYWHTHRTLMDATPQLLLVSRHVLPRPADWSSRIQLTGYVFDDDPTWEAPQDLLDFLESGAKPVYIGFGSMAEKDPVATTRLLIDAVQQAGKRAVLLSGWAGIGDMDLPDTIFVLDYAPHGWLFPRMAVVIHHGGAGTTAAGLRAGVPTIVVPALGDQIFWGRRVYELGAGTKHLMRSQLNAGNLAAAIREATENQRIRERAQELGALIREEDGVGTAVASIRDLLA